MLRCCSVDEETQSSFLSAQGFTWAVTLLFMSYMLYYTFFTNYKQTWDTKTGCTVKWGKLSDSASDVNRDNPLLMTSNILKRQSASYLVHVHLSFTPNVLYTQRQKTLTPEWPASLQCMGPRGRSTSWSRWRPWWRAAPRQERSHRKTGGTRSFGSLPSGSSWTCTTAGSKGTPSDQGRERKGFN